LMDSRNRHSETREQNQILTEQIANLSREIEEYQQHEKARSQEVSSLHKRIADVQESVAQISFERDDMRSKLEDAHTEVASLQRHVQSLQKELSLFEESLPLFEKAIDESAESMTVIFELSQKVRSLSEENDFLSIALLQAKKGHSVHTQENELVDLHSNQLQFLSDCLVEDSQFSRDLVSRNSELMTSLEEQLEEKDHVIHILSSQNSHISQTCSSLEKQLSEAKQALELALMSDAVLSLDLSEEDAKQVHLWENSKPKVHEEAPVAAGSIPPPVNNPGAPTIMESELHEKLLAAERRIVDLQSALSAGSKDSSNSLHSLMDELSEKNHILDSQTGQIRSQQQLIDQQVQSLEAFKVTCRELAAKLKKSSQQSSMASVQYQEEVLDEKEESVLNAKPVTAVVKYNAVSGSLVSGISEYLFDEKLDQWIPASGSSEQISNGGGGSSTDEAVRTLERIISNSKKLSQSSSVSHRFKFSFPEFFNAETSL
jgi:chromosome segregation ATPase